MICLANTHECFLGHHVVVLQEQVSNNLPVSTRMGQRRGAILSKTLRSLFWVECAGFGGISRWEILLILIPQNFVISFPTKLWVSVSYCFHYASVSIVSCYIPNSIDMDRYQQPRFLFLEDDNQELETLRLFLEHYRCL